MSGFYIGVDGKARKIKGGYIGIDGKARKIKKGYIGVDGVAKLCWSEVDPVLTITSTGWGDGYGNTFSYVWATVNGVKYQEDNLNETIEVQAGDTIVIDVPSYNENGVYCIYVNNVNMNTKRYTYIVPNNVSTITLHMTVGYNFTNESYYGIATVTETIS